jgi:formate hydrogenlyase transcriptional activator
MQPNILKDPTAKAPWSVNMAPQNRLAELNGDLGEEKLYPEGEIRADKKLDEIVGKSAALRLLLNQVETVAPTESTVLIYGETGTGKELVARALHNLSPRRSNAFVKVNCAAIPAGLLESELFGHERGAFTGAIAQRIGRFELANRGSVFLDEIGDVSLELQPKLLRVLQEREFERLGSTRTLRTDARLIAATNRDLAAMVMEQKFRSDLFYRLNVFPIRVPPLRERREDIPISGQPLCVKVRASHEQEDREHHLRDDERLMQLPLARQHPGTAKRAGACSDLVFRARVENFALRFKCRRWTRF